MTQPAITISQSRKIERALIKAKFGGRCAYCGVELGVKWHEDHVKAVYRDLGEWAGMIKPEHDTNENKFPSCAPCNLFKNVFSIEEFRSEIGLQAARARKYSVNFRTAERFGLIEEKSLPVVFWFEKFNTEVSK